MGEGRQQTTKIYYFFESPGFKRYLQKEYKMANSLFFNAIEYKKTNIKCRTSKSWQRQTLGLPKGRGEREIKRKIRDRGVCVPGS